ncbi:MAG: hypothetical protein KatS3mg037_0170 [Ignavibacterium sp.]|nr:MAG: hypothetical protein KatS3mg037_0170 [Ignavibacterium sp.]
MFVYGNLLKNLFVLSGIKSKIYAQNSWEKTKLSFQRLTRTIIFRYNDSIKLSLTNPLFSEASKSKL